MSQYERAKTEGLPSISAAGPEPIDWRSDGSDSPRGRIAAGPALLSLVEYPWGVEFELGGEEGSP